VALHHSHHPGIAGPERTLGQRPVHHEPSVGLLPVPAARLEFEPAPLVVNDPPGQQLVAHRVGWIVLGNGDGLVPVVLPPQRAQRRAAADHESPPEAHDPRQAAGAALPDGGPDLRGEDRAGPAVRDDFVVLGAIQERDGIGPRFSGADGMPGE
jgi:hypothetical protein